MDVSHKYYIVFGKRPQEPKGGHMFNDYESARDYFSHLHETTNHNWLSMKKYTLIGEDSVVQNITSTIR